GVEPPLVDMAHHADDFGALPGVAKDDALAKRILASKIFSAKNIVDRDDQRGVFSCLRSEKSAALQRDAHGLEVARPDDVIERPIHVVLAGGFGLTVKPKHSF